MTYRVIRDWLYDERHADTYDDAVDEAADIARFHLGHEDSVVLDWYDDRLEAYDAATFVPPINIYIVPE